MNRANRAPDSNMAEAYPQASSPRARISQVVRVRLRAQPLGSSHDAAADIGIRWPSEAKRAGERYMRLRLFDRIRRLAHRRRPESETAPGVQGRHRRAQRSTPPAPPMPPDPLTSSGPSRSAGPPPDFAPEAEDWPTPPGGPATHGWPSSPPDASQVAEASSAPGAPPVPDDTNVTRSDIRSRRAGRVSGSPAVRAGAVRAGAARARIREAPPPSAGEVAPA